MTDVQVGDKVRVYHEGVVTRVSPKGKWITVDDEMKYYGFDVEVIPSVITFKPGDVVRHKGDSSIYTLGEGGRYFSHHLRDWRTREIEFTSKHYELL